MYLHALPVIVILLVSGLAFGAGCTSPATPGVTTVATPPPAPVVTPSPPVPAALPAAAPASVPATGTTGTTGSSTPPLTVPSPAATQITPSAMGDSVDNPHIVLLEFTKDYFSSNLPDCGMKAAFPQVAGNPGYGIRPPESTLIAFTGDRMLSFLQSNAMDNAPDPALDPAIGNYIDPDTLGGANCTGVAASPTWNFVRITANFVPRNARPAEYDIGINVRSQGKVVTQLKTNQTLVLDQPVVFTWYVPLKTSETDLFDSLEMVFSKRA
eukprot:TRINITY_DN30632_c0_g1_i2.p2 TRINITY_DN30632_c0_g1~~TRINITY_DN30632_c0_g1_i2.p2  ORF type:complete len:269 (-),score=-14.29 TRINITY_DN30632_c0_g1_i2:161-967(-)